MRGPAHIDTRRLRRSELGPTAENRRDIPVAYLQTVGLWMHFSVWLVALRWAKVILLRVGGLGHWHASHPALRCTSRRSTRGRVQ